MDPVLWLILIVVFAAGIALGWFLGRRPQRVRNAPTRPVEDPEPIAPVVLDRAFLEARAQDRKKAAGN